MKDFCVLGSGISGSYIANLLSKNHTVEIFDKAKRCYNLALKYETNDPDILDRLQRLHFKMGNYKKSISLLKKGISGHISLILLIFTPF